MFTYSLKIKEHHIDSQGHMNNATYLQLFEEARWEFLTLGGIGSDRVRELQQGPIILDITMRFTKEIRLRETITIETRFLEYSGKVGRLEQKMLKEDGQVACEMVMSIGIMDLKMRKLMAPTPEWKKAFGL